MSDELIIRLHKLRDDLRTSGCLDLDTSSFLATVEDALRSLSCLREPTQESTIETSHEGALRVTNFSMAAAFPAGTAPLTRNAESPEEPAEKDAERYRWLRDGGLHKVDDFPLSYRLTFMSIWKFDSLDAAIDAAREGK